MTTEEKKEKLPFCEQCGECCRKGSPTLMKDDLELLGEDGIPWSNLITVRAGEPARSPYSDGVFYLPEERIKVRENTETRACIYFDGESNQCTIYEGRPMQCRAQACWDDEPALALAKEPLLTRADIFAGVDTLLDLIEEHDRRSTFEGLREAFEQLKESGGKEVAPVIEALSFEDHFRSFVAEKLSIPADTIELVFGRAFTERAGLFGFRVETDDDGEKVLLPNDDAPRASE